MSIRENENIGKFLNHYPQYLLDDIYDKPEIRNEFENRQLRHEKNRLAYLSKGLSNDPFIPLTVEDLMKELENNPRLQAHVLAYANETLIENPLSDKSITIRAIKTMNPDVLYHHDSEVRENFCECCKGGIKILNAELTAQIKQQNNKNEQHQDR